MMDVKFIIGVLAFALLAIILILGGFAVFINYM
jgi:hypothetical protein